MEFNVMKHARFIEDVVCEEGDEKPRGFIVRRCVECPFREPRLGGYDRDEVYGYDCMLYRRKLDGEFRRFPLWCRLKPVSEEWNRLVAIVEKIEKIVKMLSDVL